MIKVKLTLLFTLCFMLPTAAFAELWFSATMPSGFSLSSSGKGLYSYDAQAPFNPTGQSFHVSLPFVPAFGVTQYKLQVANENSTGYEETSSTLAIDMVDVLFDFSTKDVNFLAGGGWGFANFTCGVAECEAFDFSHKEARQYMVMIGVPFGLFDFHLTGHRVFSKVLVKTADKKESLEFSGIFYGFGVRFGF